MEDLVRWSLKVSQETDEALRAHLGRAGGRKGDLSRFVQEAVQAKLASARGGSAFKSAPRRVRLAEALAENHASTRALPRARFEKLVVQALAYARKLR